MKKAISFIVAVVMLMSSFGTSFAAADVTMATVQQTFKDLNGHWASDAIYKWSAQGVINGYDGLFRPNDYITRGEMACILDNIMDYKLASKNTFSDLKNGGNSGGDNSTPTVTTVSAISVSPTTMTLTAGGATGTITPTISPSNATNKNVTWSSSDTTVATVNNGIVTPLAEGTITISAVSAADPTKTATTTVIVNPADTTPPELSNGTVENLGTVTGKTATLKYHATQETGTVKYYCLLKDASASAPDEATIKASGKPESASGNPVYYQINLTELTAGQKYTAYIVMEDASGNTSDILTITGINPYSNAVLAKLSTPSVTLSSNTSGTGGLAYTVTAANGEEDSNIKEYSLEIASSSTPMDTILALTVPKNNLSGTISLDNGIVAGNSYCTSASYCYRR